MLKVSVPLAQAAEMVIPKVNAVPQVITILWLVVNPVSVNVCVLTEFLPMLVGFTVKLPAKILVAAARFVAVVAVPVTLPTKLPVNVVAATLPAVILPVADIKPVVNMLPPVMLPVAVTKPTVVILPPETLPVAVTKPTVVMLPPVMLPVAETVPAVVNLVAWIPLATVMLATSTRADAGLPIGVTGN